MTSCNHQQKIISKLKGMSSGVAHHFQHVYYLLGFYESIIRNPGSDINWPDNFTVRNLSSDNARNQILNLFALSDFLEAGSDKNIFIKKKMYLF